MAKTLYVIAIIGEEGNSDEDSPAVLEDTDFGLSSSVLLGSVRHQNMKTRYHQAEIRSSFIHQGHEPKKERT
jgi:hypothetical protein